MNSRGIGASEGKYIGTEIHGDRPQVRKSFYLGGADQANVYHVVTRTAAREILFGGRERETFRRILFKQLRF